MRRIVVALVVVMLALTLVGCGGGGEKATTTEDPAAVAAPPAVAAPAAAASADRSANDSDIPPAAFPSFTTTTTPAVFQEKLDAGRPMLIFFYDDAQQVTATQKVEVESVATDYRGLIDLVTFSVGGASTDPNTLAAVTYAKELGAGSTPYLLVVDGGGFITYRAKGYVDRAIIHREVEQASR